MIWFRKILAVLVCAICFQTAQADWTKQNANTLAWLHDIYFFNENRGFIAGSSGTFLETKDGGKSWTKRKNFTEDNILQIYFSDDYNGWLLCERDIFNRGQNSLSYLMKTTDGGESWEKIEFKNAGRTRITKIFFNKKEKVSPSAKAARFESNDGETWEKSPSSISYLLLDGAFFDDACGAVVGAGSRIYFTEDAGKNWNQANLFGNKAAKLNSLFFFNQKKRLGGWRRRQNFQTISGGKTWREQNSKVTKDLFDVFFKNTAEGWAVGDNGVILHTQTGGNVWVLEETKVRHKLEKIVFIGKKGFAVGFGGTVLVYDESNVKNQSSVKPVLQKRNQ